MGFETTLFLDRHQPIDVNLICTLCLGVFDKPSVACANGHVYCAGCLSRSRVRTASCPDCRGALLDAPPPLVRPTQNMIAGMIMQCENGSGGKGGEKEQDAEERQIQPAPPKRRRTRSNAAKDDAEEAAAAAAEDEKKEDGEEERCKWQGSPTEYADHTEACPFAMVKCPLCKKLIVRKCFEQHSKDECKYRRVECQDCNKVMKHDRLDWHLDYECPEGNAKCRYCGVEMTRMELGSGRYNMNACDDFSEDNTPMSGHYLICPKKPLLCEFYDLGCRTRLPREELPDHHAQNARYHASLVTREIESARDWHDIEIRWYIEDDRLQGHERLVFKSPRTTDHACGHSFYMKLTMDAQQILVELCSSAHNRSSNVTIRDVRVWSEDVDGDYEYHAKKIERDGKEVTLCKSQDCEYFGERSTFVCVPDDSSDDEDGEEIELTRQTIQEKEYECFPIFASFKVKRSQCFEWNTSNRS